MNAIRVLPAGRYRFDDLVLGDRIETGKITVTAAIIDAFAALTGDRFEIHMSDAGAARHGFAARVAHGLLVLSLIDGLKAQAPAQIMAIASLGWDWNFRRPVFAGDSVRTTLTIKAKRPTSRPDRGVLTLAVDVVSQSGEVVQRGTNQLMAYR